MNLEDFNNEYKRDKKKYETLEADKAKLSGCKLDLFDAKTEYDRLVSENERAKIAGKPAVHKAKEIENAKEKVRKALENLKKYKGKVQGALDKVNERYAALENNPEMKKQLDSILKTRMERSIKDRSKKLSGYKKIKEIMTDHPNFEKTVRGMTNTKKEIRKLNARIQELENKSPRTKAEETELNKSKRDLTKKEADLTRVQSEITKFISKKYPDMSKENTDLIMVMTSNIDQTIKSVKKDLDTRKIAYKKVAGKEYVTEEQYEQNLPAPLSRWQRFKNWVRGKFGKDPIVPENAGLSPEEQSKQDHEDRKQSQFRDAMKYDVVKDYLKQKEEEVLKASSKERRAESQTQRDDESSR